MIPRMKSAEDYCRTQVRTQVSAQVGLKLGLRLSEQAGVQARNKLGTSMNR